MIDSEMLKKSLEMTRTWYQNSGIMLPADGQWGVAERILLTKNNSTREKTLHEFPAWTPHPDLEYDVVEQRRADCCAEAAWLFLQLHEVFGDQSDYDTAKNILRFMFYRSGLLSRKGEDKLIGTWNWSHIRRFHCIWLDDNSWVAAILIMIGQKYPELNQEFNLLNWGLKLSDLLAEVFPYLMKNEQLPGIKYEWLGDASKPHWGSLTCLALALAYRIQPNPAYQTEVEKYHKYLLANLDGLTPSEYAYALIGATASFVTWPDELHLKTAKIFAGKLLELMDPETGNLPSMHFEAPSGKHLGDTIYTLNWAALGLQSMASINSGYEDATEKLLKLLLQIQDTTPQAHLYGCWRGMYDFEAKSWGGGDCYEGGASSIYSGWTNAPIPWTMAWALLNGSLAKF